MSHLLPSAPFVTEKRWANLPKIPGFTVGLQQPAGSLSVQSERSRSSSYAHAHPREEGCLITGDVDLSNEAAHFVSAIRAPERAHQLEKIITIFEYELKIIPKAIIGVFTLEHRINMAWFSILLHRHHDKWATIAISPSLQDLQRLENWYQTDNNHRQTAIERTNKDPGRDSVNSCFASSGLDGEFELVVLHPAYFLMDQKPLSVLLSGSRKDYYSHSDGQLRDQLGNTLPPFTLRRPRDADEDLNPILMNFAAAIRFRRFARIQPPLAQNLSPHVQQIMDTSLRLHSAIVWTPTMPQAKPEEQELEQDDDDGVSLRNTEYFDRIFDFQPLPSLGVAGDASAVRSMASMDTDDDQDETMEDEDWARERWVI
ncbi:hypothetical protein B0H16DRAFT_1697746 [Mycena metata]|uniref:Uncharacterized protein n=1 Tax=Mycena metata TaxID=1033252 RepID=A0AAD7HU32_9AGAR|nr:hypothetical protein B0H16DRAFT_1697746 [Mycena metata]